MLKIVIGVHGARYNVKVEGEPSEVEAAMALLGLTKAKKEVMKAVMGPESPTMKTGVGKVSRNDVYELYTSYG